MDNNQAKIREVFEQEKRKSRAKIKEIYEMILEEVVSQPPERVASKIVSKESYQVNKYIGELDQKMKKLAVQLILESGISENKTEIIWAGVKLSAGMPKAKLCRNETVRANRAKQGRKEEAGSAKKKHAREIDRLMTDRNCGVGILTAGAAVEALSWLVVPGWSSAAVFVKTAGVVVLGAGAIKTFSSQIQINEINRIYPEQKPVHKTERDEPVKMEEFISEICKKQEKANADTVCEWIDSVCEALISQCRQEEME